MLKWTLNTPEINMKLETPAKNRRHKEQPSRNFRNEKNNNQNVSPKTIKLLGENIRGKALWH